MSLSFDHTTHPQRVLFGTGRAAPNTVTAVEDLGARRVFLINDVSSSDLADRIANDLPIVHRVGEVVQHVPADRAREATGGAVDAAADAIVSVGGGSSTGLAKAVALETGLPIIAVPTTFAGSEATDMWGITEGRHKRTGSDVRVLPRVVVYDAELTRTLPSELAIASGFNALAHATDSLWAPRADPINRALALAALQVMPDALRALASDEESLEAREATLHGAYLAAVAFASAGAGMHHKICHVLGGTFDLPHAPTHAVVLPYVTAYNSVAAADSAAAIAAAFGGEDAAGAIRALASEVGAPTSLRDVGLAESDLADAAHRATAAIPPSNPAPFDERAVHALLRSAWEGSSPQAPPSKEPAA